MHDLAVWKCSLEVTRGVLLSCASQHMPTVLEPHLSMNIVTTCAQKNHLSGLKRRLLKLSFWNEQQLAEVKRDCFPLVRRNRHALTPENPVFACRACCCS